MKKYIFLFIALYLSIPMVADMHEVTNTNDSGEGSLRQAILDANLDANPPRSIVFNIPYSNNLVVAIELESPLPELTTELTFDEKPLWYDLGIEKVDLILYCCSLD